MGLGVGADVSGFNSSASFDGGVDWQAEGGTWARFLYDGMTQLSRQPWLTIDRCGNRLRYMDSRVAEDGANAIYALGDLATIQMTPPGHRSYIVFDANYEDHLAGFAQEHCRKLLTPDLEQIEKVPGALPRLAPRCAGRHRCRRAEAPRHPGGVGSGSGLAEGVLTGAVARWNEACERGEDDFLYPMPPEWLHAITTPPFYGCRIGGNLYRHEGGTAHQRPDAGGGHRWPCDPRPVRRLAHRRGRLRPRTATSATRFWDRSWGTWGSPSAAGICAAPLRWRTRSTAARRKGASARTDRSSL